MLESLPEAFSEPEVLVAAVVVPILGLYAMGVWMGTTGRVVVYRNYYDIMIVGLLVILPVLFGSGMLFFQDHAAEAFEILFPTLVVLEAGVAVAILMRTWNDNRSVWKTLLALYVKLPTGILFFVQLIAVFQSDTRKERRQSLLWTLLLLPLLYALVHDKSTGRLPGMPRGRTVY